MAGSTAEGNDVGDDIGDNVGDNYGGVIARTTVVSMADDGGVDDGVLSFERFGN